MDRLFFVLLMICTMMSTVLMADTDEAIEEANDIDYVCGYVKIDGQQSMNGQGGKTNVQARPIQNPMIALRRSCLDHLRNGATRTKVYTITTPSGTQQVLCDLTSEPGSAWTLVLSHRMEYRNRDNIAPFKKSLTMNLPVNHRSPNYNMYRMTLAQMNNIKSQSTHWRVMCSRFRADYRDYLRVSIADLDPLTFVGEGKCKKVEYINVRGHVGIGVTAAFWQGRAYILHHDSSARLCSFGASPGFVSSEDNFGYYKIVNRKFRCSSSDSSTSSMWFGAYL